MVQKSPAAQLVLEVTPWVTNFTGTAAANLAASTDIGKSILSTIEEKKAEATDFAKGQFAGVGYEDMRADAGATGAVGAATAVTGWLIGKVGAQAVDKAKVLLPDRVVGAPKIETKPSAASCPVGACFVAGTLVHTSTGLKPIETFIGGELVLSRDEYTQEPGLRPVVATKATPAQSLFEVAIQDAAGQVERLLTTAEHPFWVTNVLDDPSDPEFGDTHAQWVRAASLTSGMGLINAQGERVTVLSQHETGETATVYNIQVQDHHTYHVGELGVWVHNANCCQILPMEQAAAKYGAL